MSAQLRSADDASIIAALRSAVAQLQSALADAVKDNLAWEAKCLTHLESESELRSQLAAYRFQAQLDAAERFACCQAGTTPPINNNASLALH